MFSLYIFQSFFKFSCIFTFNPHSLWAAFSCSLKFFYLFRQIWPFLLGCIVYLYLMYLLFFGFKHLIVLCDILYYFPFIFAFFDLTENCFAAFYKSMLIVLSLSFTLFTVISVYLILLCVDFVKDFILAVHFSSSSPSRSLGTTPHLLSSSFSCRTIIFLLQTCCHFL